DRTLFTAGSDGIVRAWDLSGQRAAVSQVPLSTPSIAGAQPTVAPNGTLLAVDLWKTSRSIVDLLSGQMRPLRQDEAGWPLANTEPDGAAWKPDDNAYAVGGTDLSTS